MMNNDFKVTQRSGDGRQHVSDVRVGELQTACILDNNFNVIKEWHYPKSVGLVYTLCTKFLGLRPLEDEYVVMGLSSYGKDVFSQWLIDWYDDLEDTCEVDGMAVDHEDNPREIARSAWVKEYEDKLLSIPDHDAAASVQKFAEYGEQLVSYDQYDFKCTGGMEFVRDIVETK